MRFGYRATLMAARAVMTVFHGLRVDGGAHVPVSGPVLVIANHSSYYDPIVLAQGVPRELTFLARDSLRASAVYRFLTRYVPIVDIRRGEGDRGALRGIEAALRRGQAVLLFPEGTRSPDGEPQEFRGGLGLLVRATGAAVVPAWVEGAHRAWPKGAKRPRLFKGIRVRYGVPLRFGPETDRAEIVRASRDAVLALRPAAAAARRSASS